MKYALLLLNLFFFLNLSITNGQTYPEVWFESSRLSGGYSESGVHYSGESWIKNLKGQLPTSDSIFFTPKNSLEINFVSAKNGYWEANIYHSEFNSYRPKKGSSLHLKMLIKSETSLEELPALELILEKDSLLKGDTIDKNESYSFPLSKFLKKVETNKWLFIEVPLKDMENGFGDKLRSIRLKQNSNDGKTHRLFIDQIEFISPGFSKSQLTSAAVLSSAIGFERHVELTWKLPLTPSIRYIKIYRSVDNKSFQPIAIRPIFFKRYSDVISQKDKVYYYRVSWVDYLYRESPLSNVLEVKSKELDSEDLIDMFQQANVNYFIDGEEFNSGMQLKSLYNLNSAVSTKATGIGILALIAGVKDDIEVRNELLFRLEKILAFLENAERAYGVFPECLDGRSGKSLNKNGKIDSTQLVVDLESTAILMQSLLISRQYFNKNNEREKALGDKIEKIWKSVEWNKFVNSESLYLYNKWSSRNGFSEGVPLSGLSKIYVYILGLASPSYNIDVLSYYKSLHNSVKINSNSINETDSLSFEKKQKLNYPKGSNESSISVSNNIYYGIPLYVGEKSDSLSDLLMGFIALNLQSKRDEDLDYFKNIKNLIEIQHRQRLEADDETIFTFPNIAIYPFNEHLAYSNLVNYYKKYADVLWTEYGFLRAIDVNMNKILPPAAGFENGINAIMIENFRSNLIWNLYMQDPRLKNIINVLFKESH